EPISSCIPKALAPVTVAIWQTDQASRAAASKFENLANNDAVFISSNRSRLLFSFSPSVPKPTATPWRSIATTGAAPEANFILEIGLWGHRPHVALKSESHLHLPRRNVPTRF